MIQFIGDLLSTPISLHPLVHAAIIATVVGLACTVYADFKPSIGGFWRRIAEFTVRYGIPAALAQELLRGLFPGR